jgi:hypothetical protein
VSGRARPEADEALFAGRRIALTLDSPTIPSGA